MSASEYDLVVIGSGPAGQKAAVAAAKARKRVAVIERAGMIGGVSVHTGTIPSKTVREAIFQLSGLAVSALYGSGTSRVDISVENVSARVKAIVARETEIIRAQLKRNGVALYQGTALFSDPHTVEVQGEGVSVTGNKILVACGTRPARSPDIPFDSHRIVDTDHLGELGGLPKEIIVVGAGVVGLEYASFMTALGAEVTLIGRGRDSRC
jgi:NAD(P) transhydrogenase